MNTPTTADLLKYADLPIRQFGVMPIRGHANRARLLAAVAQGMARFDARMLAYCLISNHYHFSCLPDRATCRR